MYLFCAGYAGYLVTGEVVFIESRGDMAEGACTYVNTWLTEGDAKWNPTGELLAVVGVDSVEKTMKAKVLNTSGRCLLTLSLSRIQLHVVRNRRMHVQIILYKYICTVLALAIHIHT